jgi:hypothetical protein
VHYLAAGATLYGTEAQVGYEYDDKEYSGKWQHTGGNSCIGCHAPAETKHTFDVKDNSGKCNLCHQNTPIEEIRIGSNLDYDGDADTDEKLADEISGLRDKLYAAIQATAKADGNPVIYSSHAYPYFFNDTNDNGVEDAGEVNYGNRFKAWTPALMKAAHNYQHSLKETGAWAHNFAYIAQLLYDSIEKMGGDMTGLNRPPVTTGD